MILSSISPPRAGRPGAQSDFRWSRLHHALPRAAGRANRRRSRARLAQRPVQTHGQVTSQGHLGYVPASPENQTLILAPQFGIKRGRAELSFSSADRNPEKPKAADLVNRFALPGSGLGFRLSTFNFRLVSSASTASSPVRNNVYPLPRERNVTCESAWPRLASKLS